MSGVPPDLEVLAELVGTWRVTRYEDRESADQPWESSLPERFEGYCTYDEHGLWAVQVALPGEGRGYGGHLAYFGFGGARDVVREGGTVRGVLVIDVVGGSTEGMLEYADRPFELTADRVVIGDQETWIREAVRLTAR